MRKLSYKQLGGQTGKYFNMLESLGEASDCLEVFPGMKISPERYVGNNTKLLIDRQTRVMSRYTLWEEWNESVLTED